MTRFRMALVVLAGVIGCGSAANATVYAVNRSIGGGSVVGTITTDGTIGVLATANIADWDLVLSAGVDFAGVQGPLTLGFNSDVLIVGSGLTATLGTLSFDFAGAGSVLFQAPAIGAGGNWYSLEGIGGHVTPLGNLNPGLGVESVQVGDYNADPSLSGSNGVTTFAGSTETVAILQPATLAIPEPATLAILGIGLTGLRLARRRKG